MAIVGTPRLKRSAPTGTYGIAGQSTYATVYIVDTDSDDDNIVSVAEAVAAVVGEPGEASYSVGNDSDENAVLKTIVPKRDPRKIRRWYVTCNFSPRDEDEQQTGRDADGKPTTDPLLFADEIDVSTRYKMEPVTSAVLIQRQYATGQVFGGGFPGRELGTKGPIENSARVTFDPTIEDEHRIVVLRISRHLRQFPAADADRFSDAVNSDEFRYTNGLAQFDRTYPALTVLCAGIEGHWRFINGQLTWPITYSFEIDRKGWRHIQPDVGYERKHSDYPGEPDKPADGLDVVGMKDGNGLPVRQPVFLDGEGQPLDMSQANVRTVELVYAVKDEIPFAGLLVR